ncbi:hypothetical protein [Streptomyces sp. NPDC047981]|uniref:DUF7660 family protein n=1 Tax=Streptomyces sp. NPDC047981 TaxID=3154610 RepID=UPI00343E3EC0
MSLTPDNEVRSREELVAFLRELHQEFRRHGDEWENHTLERFLEALAAWVHDAPGVYRNFGKEFPADGSWDFFAQALYAATLYE